ncbi:MAG TPA: hypothetical protein VHY91_16045 [Pirellulales bacterium]|jgi:hypothetical protein|nr:hypothetical protein [Pirellulales bacterium]
MRTQQFLEHHGVVSNPFAEEDAQTDPVFKDHCIDSTYHPTWDKIYGNPAEPATSLVFGEKGSGKTALRLQIVRHLAQYNRQHPRQRLFVIEYDDFNPFLDRFRDRLSSRRRKTSDRVLAEWKLWDHMDAILSLGVTGLVDRILDVKQPNDAAGADAGPIDATALDRHQARDLLLLAACYDQSSAETTKSRWHRLRRKLRYRTFRAHFDLAFAWLVTAAMIALSAWLAWRGDWYWVAWPLAGVAAGWLPWLWRAIKRGATARAVTRNVRVGNRVKRPLRQVLMHFTNPEITGQPLPSKQRTDDRYELLAKFQGILETLGFGGIVVLVDRVDEPHLINGSVEQMRALLWPMLDNKFLKHPGIGFKLLLPIELAQYIDREDREFYQRARLDKQNMIPSLEWTGEALYDVAAARLKACAAPGATPQLRQLFDPSITDRRLMDAFRGLRVPRHLFKFMYRLFVAHCNAHTDESPVWQISSEHFESVLALYSRDQDAFDRGLKAG